MARRSTIVWAAAGGAVVGLLIAGTLVVEWHPDPEPVTGDPAEEAFVDAWERSRLGTYYVASDFHRTTPNGELESVHQLAQRPPDLIRREFGGIQGRLGNHTIMCSLDPDDRETCSQGSAELPSYEDEVAEEVSRWTNYFIGEVPLYRVVMHDDGCFDLHLTRLFPSPPYGTWARFCFDDATGAVVYTEIHRDEGTDLLRATEVRDVSDADLTIRS